MKNDPVPRRARHWARWRRNQVTSRWEHSAHLDAFGDEARTAWVCSWQRSGSTWVAQMLSSAPGTRLIYEPANLPGRLFTGQASARAPLPVGPGPELAAVERAVRGRVRGAWVDQLATSHVVHRRVVKDVRALGLLSLMAPRHPTMPIVVLIRHPLAVATSTVALGWSSAPELSMDDQLLAEVRRWASMHAHSLTAPATARAHLVTYEHLVLEPDTTSHAIHEYLTRHHRTWEDTTVDPARHAAPSATSFRRDDAQSPSAWIHSFSDVSDAVLDATETILRDTGLDRLYGRGPEPLVGPDELGSVLAAH
jgi:hypothetical protein